jgi:anti-anti-sigma factor
MAKKSSVPNSVRIAEPEPDRVDVTLVGDIDYAASKQLDAVVDRALRAGPREIRLDLADVTFFSAAGLNFLLRLRVAAKAEQAVLVAEPVPRCVQRVVTLAGIDGLFTHPHAA